MKSHPKFLSQYSFTDLYNPFQTGIEVRGGVSEHKSNLAADMVRTAHVRNAPKQPVSKQLALPSVLRLRPEDQATIAKNLAGEGVSSFLNPPERRPRWAKALPRIQSLLHHARGYAEQQRQKVELQRGETEEWPVTAYLRHPHQQTMVIELLSFTIDIYVSLSFPSLSPLFIQFPQMWGRRSGLSSMTEVPRVGSITLWNAFRRLRRAATEDHVENLRLDPRKSLDATSIATKCG
ncbi:hypothetical protein BDY19DRAFT_907830 [Irpex rosettiformis]|uniref:Uncharacterized protein n=1 Tax=Irpex rosettiformis TaxID=378272 RepID=A0ACB8TYQ9_9APHY|nr:hypothetical protein BDY19DRAFT_907830 [Irpex rosettiformis]